jgi:hypothetical protein
MRWGALEARSDGLAPGRGWAGYTIYDSEWGDLDMREMSGDALLLVRMEWVGKCI